MVGRSSPSRRVFVFFNALYMISFATLCIIPFINLLAISLSTRAAAATGGFILWPKEFSARSYVYIIERPEFLRALSVTLKRVFLGVAINVFFVVITAYPLSKEKKDFKYRTAYVWYFVFTMLFGGGLIPLYILVKNLGMIDTIWALVIPGALPIFNSVLLLNFFRGLPRELEESAFMDGASHWVIAWRIYIPLSLPALATIVLFNAVGHWNSWFDGLIYMNSPEKYPLQTYMQSLIVVKNTNILSRATRKLLEYISDRTVKSAQIFVGALPILAMYPFLQRYFMKGLVVGSVKE